MKVFSVDYLAVILLLSSLVVYSFSERRTTFSNYTLSEGTDITDNTFSEVEKTTAFINGNGIIGVTRTESVSPTTDGWHTNDTNELLYLSDKCANIGSCNVVSTLHFPICYCDGICHVYKDCCYDADTVAKTSLMTPNFECEARTNLDPFDGALISRGCPDTTNNLKINLECQNNDILAVGPWVVGQNGIVYKNKYCAECHGQTILKAFSVKVSNIDPGFLPENINYTVTNRMENLLGKSRFSFFKVTIEMIPPQNTTMRRCLIYTQPLSNLTACKTYSANPVYGLIQQTIFRNVFCVLSDTETICLGPFIQQLGIDDGLYNFFPLSVIFSFQQSTQQCDQQIGGFCIEKDFYTNFTTRFVSYFHSSKFLPSKQTNQILIAFAWSLAPDIIVLNFAISKSEQYDNASYNRTVTMTMYISKELEPRDVLEYEERLLRHKWESSIYTSNSEIIEVFTSPITMTEEGPLDYTFANTDNLNNLMSKYDVMATTIHDIDIFCEHVALQCVASNLTEYSNLVVSNIKCLRRMSETSDLLTVYNSKTLLTYFGLGSSVVTLIGSIIIYRKTDLHQSVPGSNVENLSMSVLIANIVFLVGVGANDYQNICYVVGVTLHYLWLSIFSFSSIALIYMCHNIRRMSVNSGHSGESKLSRRMPFTVLGLCIPLLVITPSLLLDNFDFAEYTLAYNGHICFPTGYPANLIFVSAPIGCSVVVNIICFLCISVTIAQQSFQSRNIRKSTSFQHVPVFLRISAVTGMFWISGILWAIFQIEAMEYIFIICCSLQGFFVAMANMTTKRVGRKIKERFNKIKS